MYGPIYCILEMRKSLCNELYHNDSDTILQMLIKTTWNNTLALQTLNTFVYVQARH